jgi:hypothetical protein
MAAITHVPVPADDWTEIDPNGAAAVELQNQSFSIPIGIVIAADEPSDDSDGYLVLSPRCRKDNGITVMEGLGGTDKLYAKTLDHSGLAGLLAVRVLETPEAP